MLPNRGYAMKAFCVCVVLLFAVSPASAQLYKWVDKDGKVRYGDTPPPGAKTSSIKAPESSGAAPAGDAVKGGKKDAKKGPLTPAEQAQEFRKRREASQKAAAKDAQEQQVKAQKNESCERTKEYLRTLESGQRIARTNAAGERYYMSDGQVAQETAKAQQSVREACK